MRRRPHPTTHERPQRVLIVGGGFGRRADLTVPGHEEVAFGVPVARNRAERVIAAPALAPAPTTARETVEAAS